MSEDPSGPGTKLMEGTPYDQSGSPTVLQSMVLLGTRPVTVTDGGVGPSTETGPT